MGAKMRLRAFLASVLVPLGATLFAPSVMAETPSKSEFQAFARVVVDETELRAGPSVSYRVIHTARRDETLALDARQTTGYWLQVTLPDGRIAYVLGDTVQTYAVDPDAPNAPSRPGILAPPPLTGARGGLAIVGGVLRTPILGGGHEAAGYLEFKPSIVVHPTLTLDGFVGLGAYADGQQLLYGGGLGLVPVSFPRRRWLHRRSQFRHLRPEGRDPLCGPRRWRHLVRAPQPHSRAP